MLILILLLLILPVHAAERSVLEQAKADHKVRLAQSKVAAAELDLIHAQEDNRPEHDIKECRVEVQKAAEEMLFTLAHLKESYIRLEDIDFCLAAHKPDVNALSKGLLTPLMVAVQNNSTLTRELIRAGADLNRDEWITALELASDCNFGKECTMHILLEAGATPINRAEVDSDGYVDSDDDME